MLERNVVVGPFQCNCRILVCPETGRAGIIDAGDDAERILTSVNQIEAELGKPIRVDWLLHTHGHLDHVGATRTVKRGLVQHRPGAEAARIALHPGDEELYLALLEQGRMFGLTYETPDPLDHRLADEEEIRIGNLRLSVLHTPGHSPGSVCLRLHDDTKLQAPETLYSGDTLFYRSVGRTDLWGADGEAMFRNIRMRILTLDGDTRVCPGHGPETRIGDEKRENPFLN